MPLATSSNQAGSRPRSLLLEIQRWAGHCHHWASPSSFDDHHGDYHGDYDNGDNDIYADHDESDISQSINDSEHLEH